MHHDIELNMAKMTVRVPGGMHFAISEIAESLGLSISETAGLLMGVGLQAVNINHFSQKARELMLAETLEVLGSLIRLLAEYEAEDRRLVQSALKDVIIRLQSVFGENVKLGVEMGE